MPRQFLWRQLPGASMNLQQSPTRTVEHPGAPNESEMRLHGRLLFLARVGWGTAVALILGLFMASLPTYLAHLQGVCADKTCAYLQLSLNNAHLLQALGISVGGYAALTLTFTLLVALVWVVTGGVVAWRKSDDWIALLVALLLV